MPHHTGAEGLATIVVTSATGHALLLAACVGILTSAGAMFWMHGVQSNVATSRVPIIAGVGAMIGFVALGAALLISSGV
jgi:hypothetical protein